MGERASIDLNEVARELKHAVSATLEACERSGMSARNADELIKDSVFEAWWDWNYDPFIIGEPPRG